MLVCQVEIFSVDSFAIAEYTSDGQRYRHIGIRQELPLRPRDRNAFGRQNGGRKMFGVITR